MTQREYNGPEVGSSSQVQAISKELGDLYPEARYELNFSTPFELLVATILAAQCTDERVNAVTQQLFVKYRHPEDYLAVAQEELEQDIRPTGFYRNKAKTVRATCQYLIEHDHGEVPDSMAELVKLPGVARKTANVVLANAFGKSEGIIVDTHVLRLAQRFGWTKQKDAAQVEHDMMQLVPRSDWTNLAHRMIYHGRQTCIARKPKCDMCALAPHCPSAFTF
ncbi:MAG TPA: endonuclease III [Ktedonobacteraceae bacterium]|jgi:endonuclease-3